MPIYPLTGLTSPPKTGGGSIPWAHGCSFAGGGPAFSTIFQSGKISSPSAGMYTAHKKAAPADSG